MRAISMGWSPRKLSPAAADTGGMYSSLLSIDFITTDHPPAYIQLDHRRRAEVEAEPEISVLFALVRLAGARARAVANGDTTPLIVYSTLEDPPPFLADAIAASGAFHERMEDCSRVALTARATPAELADRAFRELADRVAARYGIADRDDLLRALDADTQAAAPDLARDEAAYWIRVHELAAVAGELVRAHRGGSWVTTDRPGYPFELAYGDRNRARIVDRARRSIDEGNGRMIALVDAIREPATVDGPILPSLRSRDDAIHEDLTFRSLLDEAHCPNAPVIAYGRDSPKTFSLVRRTAPETRDVDALHAEALATLARQVVQVEELGGRGIYAVGGSYFASEKLLDVAFMRSLHERLGASLLAASVPRRGLMFVTSGHAVERVAQLEAMTRLAHAEPRSISDAVLLVGDGQIVGAVRTGAPPPKPRGLFRRLFGRG
jgi:hypothetical protein